MTIKSDKEVTVLVDNHGWTQHSTTIKYNNRLFKLISNYRNGSKEVYIYMFTENNGWVLVYGTEEIPNVICISYVADRAEQEAHSVQNYYTMVKHIKKVFC